MSALSNTLNQIKSFRITRRELRLFVLSTVMFTSMAAGAMTLDSQFSATAHSQSVASADQKGICSASKFFR